MGDVTLRNFLETHKLLPDLGHGVDVFVGLPKLEYRGKAEEVTRALRNEGLRVMTPLSCDGFGNQLKLATKHGARFVILFGERELNEGKVLVKELATGTQSEHLLGSVAREIKEKYKQ